jgi:hypothetical protein
MIIYDAFIYHYFYSRIVRTKNTPMYLFLKIYWNYTEKSFRQSNFKILIYLDTY